MSAYFAYCRFQKAYLNSILPSARPPLQAIVIKLQRDITFLLYKSSDNPSSDQAFPQPQSKSIMSVGLPSDEVAEDYKNSLEDLTMNSRYEISNLTVIAKENTEHGMAISRVLENHIRNVSPSIS